MRILLLTDTHNELEPINQLAEQTNADCVVHCGDFGFYDQESPERLSRRELSLRIKHSHLPKKIRKKSFKYSPEEAKSVLKEHDLLTGFIPYLTGEKEFQVPVYAVWGNHEDIETVRMLQSGELKVPNLHLIDEDSVIEFAEIKARFIGIGGNFYLEGGSLFAPSFTGSGGRIRASWLQYAKLLKRELEREKDDTKTFFVSHVSPGKSECRLLERLCLLIGANYSLSGHMDPPLSHAYSLFGICQPEEALARSEQYVQELGRRWADERESCNLSEEEKALIDFSLEKLTIEPLPEDQRGNCAKKGSFESFFRQTQFINLADAPEGWSILEVNEGMASLESHSHWKF